MLIPTLLFKSRPRKCTKHGVVLIFDECTSGFRETFGGLHLKFGISPDIATFGKALGNGFAITAALGAKPVMEVAQDTFISSTFWTEGVGFAAANATLQRMEETFSWTVLPKVGRKVKKAWSSALEPLEVYRPKVGGRDSIPTMTFDHKENLVLKTILTQQMLERSYLSSNIFYASLAHDDDSISLYREALAEVAGDIAHKLEQGIELNKMLDGEVCHSSFKRLT